MATATILQLTQAISITGAEWLEAAQGDKSVRLTTFQIAALGATIGPIGPTGVIAAVPSTGENDNYAPSGFGSTTGFLDLTPTAGANLTGLQAGFDGQIVTITNLGAFVLTLNALNGGSSLANQFRMAADVALSLPYSGKSFKYSATIGMWVAM